MDSILTDKVGPLLLTQTGKYLPEEPDGGRPALVSSLVGCVLSKKLDVDEVLTAYERLEFLGHNELKALYGHELCQSSPHGCDLPRKPTTKCEAGRAALPPSVMVAVLSLTSNKGRREERARPRGQQCVGTALYQPRVDRNNRPLYVLV